ncbi:MULTISPECIES: hypothetical protein [unclassified Micromonospora]
MKSDPRHRAIVQDPSHDRLIRTDLIVIDDIGLLPLDLTGVPPILSDGAA